MSWSSATRRKPIAVAYKDGSGALKQCLRLRDVVGFGLGCTVGGGIFVATGQAVMDAGPAVLLSFLVAAFGCSCSGLCYAEMSIRTPTAGSSYNFAYVAVGELAAFVVGIINIMGNVLSAAAVARGWAAYLELFFVELGVQATGDMMRLRLGAWDASPMALLLVLCLVLLNFFGTKATAAANGAATAVSVAMLGIFIAGATFGVDSSRWRPFLPNGFAGVVRGAGTVFFAYLGFDVLACLGEEAQDPLVVPWGIVLTLIISTGLYCATATAFTGLVTCNEVDIESPLASASRLRGLDWLALVVAGGAVGNTMTTVLASILGAPRICYVMAQDGLLPRCLASVNKHGTPVCALFFTAIPAAIFAFLSDFDVLAHVVSAGALCSFSLVCCSLILVRYDQQAGPVASPSAAAEAGRGRAAALSSTVVGRPTDAGDEETSPSPGGESGAQEGRSSAEAPLESELDTFIGDREDEEPVAGRDVVSRSLGAYMALCLATGTLLRLRGSPLWQELLVPMATLLLVVVLGAVLSGLLVTLRLRASAAAAAPATAAAPGFMVPLFPYVPLTGIAMNMLLLSQMPTVALLGTLGVVVCCAAAYFGRGRLTCRSSIAKRTVAS